MERDRRRGKDEETSEAIVPHVSQRTFGRSHAIQDDEKHAKQEELLPGFPNDMVFTEMICKKLSWKALQCFSCVSTLWRNTVRNPEIYEERERSRRTETVLVMSMGDMGRFGICVYSLTDNFFSCLPPIPGLANGIPRHWRSVALDRSIYVFGGYRDGSDLMSEKVYVIDLAGQREWKECADMIQVQGQNLAPFLASFLVAGVTNGKVYALYLSQYNLVVYDPSADTWSLVEPMADFGHVPPNVPQVANGEEWLVLESLGQFLGFILAKTGWRKVYSRNYLGNPRSWCQSKGSKKFANGGAFYCVSSDRVHIYNFGTRCWRQLHKCSFQEKKDVRLLNAVLGPGGELFAIVQLTDPVQQTTATCLFKTTRFNTKDKWITWQKVDTLHSLKEDLSSNFLCALQL